ncbi:PhzF family phenazine biosynthesis protein [Vibrio gazogenes]|uniref:Phenazine biosynthesis protein PhzF family n=1 Tax=Vibrio gazogenes DSM 21264 = NBRC 103151 TaxID=1123492 RepID=A0A1M4UPZ5_VIBGA|nr:PhzF family phenazine biosynthesis protein [Vibrio gazogenes]USP15714.1 PhzF family phenazine biosynthesis protein [Vibrio gazogenes]SHE58717.1 phenazine biosynthesis protein PhzF family [Vibrio gazogenes DSM 21264] [Vibrio gazogenes DSM 21264 = NBRC 103151]SJN57702.1 putative isomerase YddE [Vibrio gazogenes]
MKDIEVILVNAFIENGSGGNPAGVVLYADDLSDEEKQEIANAVGYSETAFVSQDDDVDFALSFFTPTDEVDFCGHATLAAFSVMYQKGIITNGEYTQKTKAGRLGVTVASNGYVVMEQNLPEYLHVLDYESVSALIGIDAALLESTQLPVEVISTGLPDIIVPLPRGFLDKIQVDEDLLRDFSQQHQVTGMHVFELCDESSGLTASCRNFAPLFGIPEESATGSANGALACYLTKHLYGGPVNHFTFEQGRAMGKTSRLTASVESNEFGIIKVSVGGCAQTFGERTISVC